MNNRSKLLAAVCSCMLIAVSSWAAVNRSFASIALAEPWWEMGKTEANITPGEYLIVRELPNMDALAVDSLDLLLRAETTFSNPKIDQQTHTGTFVNVSIELLAQQDRGVTVRQELLLVNTLAGSDSATLATNLAALASLNTRDNEILNLFGLQTGEGDNQGFIFSTLNPSAANKTACMDTITDADLVAQLAVGWTYADRHWKEEKGGAATFAVAFRKVAWTNAWSDADQVRDGKVNGFGRIKSSAVRGVSSTSITSLLSDAISPDDGFVVLNVSVSEAANGSLDAFNMQGTAFTSVTDYLLVSWERALNNNPRRLTRVWFRRSATAKDTLVDTGGTAQADFSYAWPDETNIVAYVHSQCVVRPHGDRTYDVIQHLEDTTGINDGDGSINVYWKKNRKSYHYESRSDGRVRIWEFENWNEREPSYEEAFDVIDSAEDAGEKVLERGTSVRQVAPLIWEAEWIELEDISAWNINPF